MSRALIIFSWVASCLLAGVAHGQESEDEAGRRGQPLIAAAAAPQAATYTSRHALVVGIDDYRDPGFQDLSYAEADAQAIYQRLLGDFGFPPGAVRLLLGEQATQSAMESALEDWLGDGNQVRADGLVFVFYAGHGVDRTVGEGRQRGYLVPVDGRVLDSGDYAWSSLVGMNAIEDVSEVIPAKHALFVLDCCFGGLAVTRASAPAVAGMAHRARQVLTAGGADQTVLDAGGDGHSVFTQALLDGLDGAADRDGDGVLTFGELYQHVGVTVQERTAGRQTPLQANLPDHEGGSVGLWRRVVAPPAAAGGRPEDWPDEWMMDKAVCEVVREFGQPMRRVRTQLARATRDITEPVGVVSGLSLVTDLPASWTVGRPSIHPEGRSVAYTTYLTRSVGEDAHVEHESRLWTQDFGSALTRLRTQSSDRSTWASEGAEQDDGDVPEPTVLGNSIWFTRRAGGGQVETDFLFLMSSQFGRPAALLQQVEPASNESDNEIRVTGIWPQDGAPAQPWSDKLVRYQDVRVVVEHVPAGLDQPEHELWELTTMGHDKVRLGQGAQPATLPEHRLLAFVRRDPLSGHQVVWRMTLDAEDVRPVAGFPDADCVMPSWSPDGRWIAFASDHGRDEKNRQQWDVWVVDAEGAGEPIRVTHNASEDDAPAWLPDGSALVFRSNRGGAWNLWKADVSLPR